MSQPPWKSYGHNLFSSVVEHQLCDMDILVSTDRHGSLLYAFMFICILAGLGRQPERSVCAVSWARNARTDRDAPNADGHMV